MLRIDGERCVHARAAAASCQRCVQICPQAAWRLADDGLGFDEARCDGCGLCAAVCPTGALALTDDPLATSPRRATVVTVACDRIPATGPGEPPPGTRRLACVHGIDEWQWLQWQHDGVRQVQVHVGDCDACARGRRLTRLDRLPERAAVLNRVLQMRGLAGLALQARVQPAGGPQVATERAARPGRDRDAAARRSFLGLARPAAATVDPSWPVRRLAAQQDLRRLGPGAVLWAVSLRAEHCDACGACARLCPTGALTRSPLGETASGALVQDMAACVGCGLCADVCAPGAVVPLPVGTASGVVRRLRLDRVACAGCGRPHVVPVESVEASVHRDRNGQNRCPACRSTAIRCPGQRLQEVPPSSS